MRLRFAPSPTGSLHIGNARTAIWNYLFARKNNGKLILRIEDTDKERSSKESEESIMNDLRWLGLQWDEGPDVGGDFGPYRQSERFDIYNKYTLKLLEEGNAYYCYCTPEELNQMRAQAKEENRVEVYSGRCRKLSNEDKEKFIAEGRKATVRFRVPEGEKVIVDDRIRGKVAFNSENIGGDFIIVRSDGTPVYNYIVVIDDSLMEITHVIRGEDHLSNTPKQILIARALGLPVPIYHHHSLVLGPDRSKLSKRHGITSVNLYREEGYLPDGLFNYISMLGWATESGEEILTKDEIIKQSDLLSMGKSAAVFDFQKLKWMNGIYIRNKPVKDLISFFTPYIEDAGYKLDKIPGAWLEAVIDLLKGYCEILSDIKEQIKLFIEEIIEPDDEADKILKEDHSLKIIKAAKELLNNKINENNYSSHLVNAIKEATSLKGKNLFIPIRIMITGKAHGPELDKVMQLLGFEKCVKRIEYMYNKYI